ncbi:hypothetical protein MPSEU_000383300 [Mayamaea pseudoterrestris]|nr:hypothetical protein MPSEU_000383300 [Mayamaea pseudoterrestris]
MNRILIAAVTITSVALVESNKILEFRPDGSFHSLQDERNKNAIDCRDQHDLCSFWAEAGECTSNADFMEIGCPISCDTCEVFAAAQSSKALHNHELADVTPEQAAQLLEQSLDFGVRQSAVGNDAKGTLLKIQKTIDYMKDEKTLALPFDILENCLNGHELCSFWGYSGECETNKVFMNLNCAPTCFACNLVDMEEERCPLVHDAEPALRPGDLNQMFARIVDMAPSDWELDESAQLNDESLAKMSVQVLSSPGDDMSDDEISIDFDKSAPPWILVLSNLLSDDECDALIELGDKYEFVRSLDLGPQRFDGSFEHVTSDRLTTYESWCSERLGCRSEDVAARVHERIAGLLDVAAENSENLQVVRIQEGQFHRTHHDFQAHQTDLQCGPRILTLHIFLNDSDDGGGGGVEFPFLDLTVKPKKGQALLWPNVLNSNPMLKDERLFHQLLEVGEGVQYAAKAHLHLYDFLTPHTNNCF